MSNVLHIVDSRTPQDMLAQLALLAGDDDRVVSAGPAPENMELDLPVSQIHCPLGVPALAAPRLKRIAARADVIHAWSPKAAQLAVLTAAGGQKPMVYSLPTAPGSDTGQRIAAAVDEPWVTVTVPTWSSATLARRYFDDARIEVLAPPAAAADQSSDVRSLVRKQLSIADHQTLLVSPAEMIRGAGHKYASWAHAIVREIIPDVLLCFASDGPDHEHVRFFAGTTSFRDEVFFTAGRFSVAEALAAGDIALFLNEYDTGVGSLATAMAAGKAIVATETPNFAQCAPHYSAALLVPAADPRAASAEILKLIESPQLAEQLSQAAAQQAAEKFDPLASRRRLMEIYASAGAAAAAGE